MVFSYRVVRVVVFVSLSVDPGNMSQANKQQKPQHHHHGKRSFSIPSFLCCPWRRNVTCWNLSLWDSESDTIPQAPGIFRITGGTRFQRRAWERSNNSHRIEYRGCLKNLNANCKSHAWHSRNEFSEDFWRNYIFSYIDCLLSFPCHVSPWCHNWLWGLILHTILWTSEETTQITQGLGTVGGDLLCQNVQLFSKCFLEILRYTFFCIKWKSWVTGCSHKHQGDRADLSDWQLVCDQQRRVYSYMPQSNELKLMDISFETCVEVIRQNSVKLGKTNFSLSLGASYCQRLDFFCLFKSFSDAISDSACALWGSTMPRLLLWHFVASQKCTADSKRNSWLCWKVPLPGIAGQLWDMEVQKRWCSKTKKKDDGQGSGVDAICRCYFFFI